MATLDSAIRQMATMGMPPLPDGIPRTTGRVVRYGPKKRAWYVLHEYLARNGKRYVSGAFGIWGQLDSTKVEMDVSDMDQEERERLARARAEAEAAEVKKRADRARFAANRALQQWNAGRASLPEGQPCAYLQKKGVAWEKGLRVARDGTLLVPMIRYDVTEDQEKDLEYTGAKRLVGLQKIAPDGAKLFNRGMAKEGAACRLGKAPKDGDPVFIAEGLATALSIRQAFAQTAVPTRAVFVAFDAYNLAPVARILRKLYPASPLIFCADDDAYLVPRMNKLLRENHGVTALTDVPEKEATLAGRAGDVVLRAGWQFDQFMVPMLTGAVSAGEKLFPFVLQNTGRTRAHQAAAEVGNAGVCWPEFADRPLGLDPDAKALTDFNDLHAIEGLAPVTAQLEAALAKYASTPSGSAAPGEKGKAKKKGGGNDDGDVEWNRFWQLVDRFTLIYPTDTAYDHELGDIVKIEHMRLKFGSRYVSLWLGSAKRRDVDLPDVVFDPTGAAKPPKLNLFRGFGVEPAKPDAKGSCEKLLALAHYLCGENPEDTHTPVTSWVLRWMAYPLQNPGAKMLSALVFYGKEGTGKNLLFSAMREIYGTHGGIITQRQLESQFNLWLSAKLFLVANEVVTRQEMRHNVGFLKNLITEPEIWINRKQRDERCEENHANMVFFSNEAQPLQISPDDRRFMVIRTPAKREKAFYKEVVAELRSGGAAAFYRYLLDLDLGEFAPETEPIETRAKRDLIEIGMSAPQLLWQDIHDEELPLPYCPCLVEHLYRVFQVWSRRNGEKMPARINRFIPDFMSMNGVRRRVMRVRDIDFVAGNVTLSKDARQRKVLLMGEPPNGEELEAWVQNGVMRFAEAAAKYWGEQ